MESVFISPNILRLYDRVLADLFPLLFALFIGIAISKTDPKLKNSVDSITPKKGLLFSVSTLFFALSVQANVTCDLRLQDNANHQLTQNFASGERTFGLKSGGNRKVHALVGFICLFSSKNLNLINILFLTGKRNH